MFAPLMVWIVWRLRRTFGPPALFRQRRVGLSGREFIILKFRTMASDGSISTPLCHRLRGTALDELPQLINILRGEMSFVGPRPLIPEELSGLDQVRDGRRRLCVRPGLAGLAQLRSDKSPTLLERIRLDLFYIDHCNFWLDLRILFESVRVTGRSGWEKAGPKISPEKL